MLRGETKAAAWGVAALLVLAPAGSTRAEPANDTPVATPSAPPSVCLAGAKRSRPASRFECALELAPELLQLGVLYEADGWSGGGASSWQDLRERPLPGIEFDLRELAGHEFAPQRDVEARMRLQGRSHGLPLPRGIRLVPELARRRLDASPVHAHRWPLRVELTVRWINSSAGSWSWQKRTLSR